MDLLIFAIFALIAKNIAFIAIVCYKTVQLCPLVHGSPTQMVKPLKSSEILENRRYLRQFALCSILIIAC
jgi:hypothetical protein